MLSRTCFQPLPTPAAQLMGMSNAAASTLVATYLLGGGLGGLLGGWIGDRAAARWPDHGRIAATQFSVIVGVPFALLLFKVGKRRWRGRGLSLWRGRGGGGGAERGRPRRQRRCAALWSRRPAAAVPPPPAPPPRPAPAPAPTLGLDSPRPRAGPAHGRQPRHRLAVRPGHRRLGGAHRLARALLQQPRLCGCAGGRAPAGAARARRPRPGLDRAVLRIGALMPAAGAAPLPPAEIVPPAQRNLVYAFDRCFEGGWLC